MKHLTATDVIISHLWSEWRSQYDSDYSGYKLRKTAEAMFTPIIERTLKIMEGSMDRLEQIKENRFMPYGALGVVAIKAEDRDWLIQEVEKLTKERDQFKNTAKVMSERFNEAQAELNILKGNQ